MNIKSKASLTLSIPALALASCAYADSGESAETVSAQASGEAAYTVTDMGEFSRPWAIAFIPGTDNIAITEKAGALKFIKTATGETISVSGVPEVDYGGQGGFGDIAFLESEAGTEGDRTVFLSWAEAGDGDTRGAVVGRGTIACDDAANTCAIKGLEVIWRQAPKVTGKGHYSHRISISPDEQYLFIASGDRQKLDPAQDTTNTLGTIVRLNLDGSVPADNPMAGDAGVNDEIWSFGHRNILGMDWDADGRLWEIEHGPAGGDELNLVKAKANYGWPTRSYGNHYNGDPITDHSADDGFTKPAAHWTPVIAPGDMIIYSGEMFGGWKNHALIAGLQSKGLVLVEIDGETANEMMRIDLGGRIRSVDQAPDGSIWVVGDGESGKLMRITAK